jgi:hypothetical protein
MSLLISTNSVCYNDSPPERVRAKDSSNPVPYVRVAPATGVQERQIMGLIFRHYMFLLPN